MKITKKIISLLLVIMLIVSGFAVGVSAASVSDLTYKITDGEAIITGCNSSAVGELTIPSTIEGYPVTSIDWLAFCGCRGLKNIIIPNSVTSIGDYAFSLCTGLTSVTIPSSVMSIGNFVFDECTGLTSIALPDSVTSIGDHAFYYCTGLTSITLPDRVTNIDDYAFYECTSLTSVTIPDSVTSIGKSAFTHCKSLTSITIPNSVTSIGDFAFNFCTGLTSITIGNGVTSIGESAFGHTSLTSITIPNSVTSIGGGAFDECTGLTSITIGNSVTSIGSGAFYNCTSLTSITIPDSVTSIGGDAFLKCTGLTSITIPNSVTKIGSGAFEYCTGLTSIEVDNKNKVYDSRNNCNAIIETATNTLICGCKNTIIPNSVMSIGDYAFNGCYGLISITIPNSVTSIGDYAFYDCYDLISITIPNGVTSIGDYAFYNCYNLISITISNSVTSIGDFAFNGCANLTNITISDSITSIGEYSFSGTAFYNDSANWDNNVLYVSDYLIQADESLNGDYKIKDGTKVIADSAFSVCTGLTNITVPNSVTSIGKNTFYYCTGLASVTIPNSVTSIGKNTFYYCTGLASVTIPNSVTSIGESAFRYTSLISITVPNSVTSIGDYAFDSCTGLTSINIPSGVTSIGDFAFSYCTGLTSITIPNSVTNIGGWAFSVCTGLTSITIPNSVTSIDFGVFGGCTGLTSITMPNSVTSIGNWAFDDCYNLTDVYYSGTEEQWNSINIEDYNECLLNATIHFNCTPSGSYTVTFDPNGGSVSHASETSDESVILPTPTRDGYTCLGWSEDSEATDAAYLCGAKYKPQSDITLYAVWKANSYTIKFYDGSTLLGSKSLKFDESGTLSYGKVPVKEGYHFVGWSTIKGGPALFSNGQSIKGLAANDGAIVSYYAVWEKDENEVITDKDTGIVLDAPADAFEGNPTLKIDTVLSGSSFDIVSNQVGGLKCSVFSIETYVDGVKTQPNGYVTVKIPVPDGFDAQKCKLYYVNTNKNVAEEIKIQIVNNFIVFQTNHFSDWAVVETKGKVNSVSLGDIELNYKSTANINPTIEADSGVKYKVEYKSSNTKVVTVDNNGNVYAAKKGNATITCTVTDEYGNQVSDTCNVTVGYTWWQWIIKIVLFGWIWY